MKIRQFRHLAIALVITLLLPGAVLAHDSSSALRGPRFADYDPGLELEATSAMVVDLVTGDILFEKNADERMGPASLVKVGTLSLVFDALRQGEVSLQDAVPVSERAWAANVPGSRMFIEAGDEIPLDLLIQGIAVASGNDASIAVAEYLGGSEEGFVSSLNSLANELGMENTTFRNSHGLPAEGQFTTARDMVRLARYFSLEFPEAEAYTSQKEFVYGVETPHRHWNGLLFTDDRVVGLKTGFTGDSGFHLAATARDGDRHYLAIVMGVGAENSMEYPEGTATREGEAGSLLNWAFNNFELHNLRAPSDLPDDVRVYGGRETSVAIVMERDIPPMTLPKGTAGNIRYEYTVDEPLRAPLATGDRVGEIVVSWDPGDGEASVALGNWGLYPEEDVELGGLWRRFIDWLVLLFSG